MQPHDDDYLSNFSKPITEQVVYSTPNLPPPDGTFLTNISSKKVHQVRNEYYREILAWD